jgi:DNA replicative helicase MCM subunit Mcm2 (Cdc46/Mcm family)
LSKAAKNLILLRVLVAVKDYVAQAALLPKNEKSTLFVNFQHVLEYDDEIAKHILMDYYRVEPFLNKALQNFMRKHHVQYARKGVSQRATDAAGAGVRDLRFSCVLASRADLLRVRFATARRTATSSSSFMWRSMITRRRKGTEHPPLIAVSSPVTHLGTACVRSIRELKTEKIGRLTAISGTVTRSSQVGCSPPCPSRGSTQSLVVRHLAGPS